MEGVIYKYTNTVNGKIYIGQTIDEERRKGIVTKGTTGMHWKLIDGKRVYIK